MGVFRKITSVSTLGLVDLRSDKERIARSTRQTAKATDRLAAAVEQQNTPGPAPSWLDRKADEQREQRRARMRMPDGWYPDQTDPTLERWWDGTAWSGLTRPVS